MSDLIERPTKCEPLLFGGCPLRGWQAARIKELEADETLQSLADQCRIECARAEKAENDYEELKNTLIEKIEAVRAEYLGKFLSAASRAEKAEAERNAIF